MGLIQLMGGVVGAAAGAIGGNLADQWLETIEPAEINNGILATYGVRVRRDDKRSVNKKGTADVITNGSVIHVPENTYMLLVDGGKIVGATDMAGYYQVDNGRAPSLFFRSNEGTIIPGYNNTNRNAIQRPGGLKNTILDSWERFKFGGGTPLKQTVVYVNQQEIPDFRFGTKQPILFADRTTLNGPLLTAKVTSFGTYSIKISDPILFYREVCSKTGKTTLTREDIGEQYTNEYLMALQTSLASLAKEGMSVVEIQISTSRIGKEMADVLDSEWQEKRGFYINSVGIASIGLDDKTNEVLESMNADSILVDPNRRAARMTRGVSAGIEAAGSNENGAMMGFAGIGMGMNASGMGSGMGQVMNPQANTYPQGQGPYPNYQGQNPYPQGQNPYPQGQAGYYQPQGGYPPQGQYQGQGGYPQGQGGYPTQGVYPGQGHAYPNHQVGYGYGQGGYQGQGQGQGYHGQGGPANHQAHMPQPGLAWACPNCQTPNQGKFCMECGSPKPQV